MSPILEVTRSMVRDYMSRLDPSHDMAHVERVVRNALKLAEQESMRGKVDLMVIELAALCHDIGDAKYNVEHEDVLTFLTHHGYSKAALVAQIVQHIGYQKELKWKPDDPLAAWRSSCLELHAVQDADKLDAIGAFGVLRCAAYSGAKGIMLHQSGMQSIDDKAQPSKATAIGHFHEKLFRLAGMMRTPAAQKMAEQRTEFMRQFIHQIEQEDALLS